MARLVEETGALRRRAARELALFGEAASWLDYRLFLCRMYGFVAPAERALGAVPELAAVVPDAALRNHKGALLAHDLIALGIERGQLAQLPRIALPALALPEAVGWLFVLEAATRAGRELTPQLAPRLPAELEAASAYLGCYGAERDARWRELGDAIDAYADDAIDGGAARAGAGAASARVERIAVAAIDGLVRLHRWLAPSAQPRGPRARSATAV